MAQRYELKAKGEAGTPYRVELHDSTYSGTTVTQIDADDGFLEWVGGSEDRVGTDPIWGREARLNARTSADLSPLYGLRDRDVEVRIYDTSDSSIVYKGYLLTDFLTDKPYSPKPGIELRVVDGLTTLEGDSLEDLQYASPVAVSTLFAEALGLLFASPLDVEIGTEWYPSSGGVLGSSDCPLQNVKVDPNNYREDRPEGNWFNLLDVLKDLQQSQGLDVRQARIGGELVWAVHQRSAKEGGSLKTWRFAPDGTLRSGQPVTRDLTKTISVPIEREPTREFERRVQSVTVEYNHPDLSQLVLEGGFEDQGAEWSLTSYDGLDAEVLLHDNLGATPPPTEQNKYAFRANHTQNPSSSDVVTVATQGGFEVFDKLPGGSFGSIGYKSTYINEPAGRLLFKVGGKYLTDFSIEIQEDTLKGEVTLAVDDGNGNGVQRPIPEGARLPIGGVANNAFPAKASIKVSERVERGSGEIKGELNGEVKAGDYLYYAGFQSSDVELFSPAWMEKRETWKDREIYFSLEDGNGDLVTGTGTLRLQFAWGGRNSSNFPKHFWDDIKLAVYGPDGSALNASRFTASVPEYGQARSLGVRSGAGPTDTSLSRYIGETPGGTSFRATNWGIGSGGGSLSLAGLNARERLRGASNHLERYKLTLLSREDPSFRVEGHEVLELDGTDYTVASVRTRPDDGRTELVLLELKDYGTSDITVETTRSTDSTTSGSGSNAGSASGQDSDVVAWGDLQENLEANVPIVPTKDSSGTITELHGVLFPDSSPTIEWRRDPRSDIALELYDETNNTSLLRVDEFGNVLAAGEVEAFADGSGTSSTTNSELAIEDPSGTTLTTDAKKLVFQGDVSLSEPSDDEIVVDIGSTASDFQAGNALSFDTSTSPRTLNVVESDLDGILDADTLDGVELANIGFSDISATRYTDSEAVSAIQSLDQLLLNGAPDLNGTSVDDLVVEKGMYVHHPTDGADSYVGFGDNGDWGHRFEGGPNRIDVRANSGSAELRVDGNTVWHDGNADSRAVDAVEGQSGLSLTPNVGIGTTSPRGALEVTGDHFYFDANGQQVRFSHDGSRLLYEVYENGNNKWDFKGDNGDILWQNADNNPLIHLSQNERVGLLTNNPQYDVEVAGDLWVGKGSDSRSQLVDTTTFDNAGGLFVGDAGFLLDNDNSAINLVSRTRIKFFVDENSGSAVDAGTIDRSGNATFAGEVEAFSSSDERLKNDLTRVEDPLDVLDEIAGYRYEWNEEAPSYKQGRDGVGLLAQEVREVLPEAVRENASGYLGLQYEQLVPVLVEAVKELRSEVETLQSQLEA